MKITRTIISVALFAAGLSVATTALANDVPFGRDVKSGEFSCTVEGLNNNNAKVVIQTHHVNVSGFCSGNQYVTNEGRIEVPAANAPDFFNKYYFKIQKSRGLKGYISANVEGGAGNITCSPDKGAQTTLWGDGINFCALPPG